MQKYTGNLTLEEAYRALDESRISKENKNVYGHVIAGTAKSD